MSKRKTDVELSKDECERQEEAPNNETEDGQKSFAKASQDVMKQRKIFRVKHTNDIKAIPKEASAFNFTLPKPTTESDVKDEKKEEKKEEEKTEEGKKEDEKKDEKKEEEKKDTPFVFHFGSNSQTTPQFNFGSFGSTTTFSFGSSNSTFNFNFPTTSADAEEDDDPEKENAAAFGTEIKTAVLPKEQLKTGEEDEETLFSATSKMYELSKGEKAEWKEKGRGELKINRTKDDAKKHRLLMRTEVVFKLICNVSFSQIQKAEIVSDKAVKVFTFQKEGEDDKVSCVLYLFRFREKETAKKLCDIITETKKASQ